MTSEQSSTRPFSRLNYIIRLVWSESDAFARRLALATILFVLASSVILAVTPVLLKFAIDDLEESRAGDAGFALVAPVLAYAIALLLGRLLSELRGYYIARTDQRIQRRISNRVFRHILLLPFRFHLNRRTGSMSQTLRNGLIGIRAIVHHLTLTILPVSIELGTMIAVLSVLGHFTFILIIISSAVLYAITYWYCALRIGIPAGAAADATVNSNTIFADSVLNHETVKAFGTEEIVQTRFADALTETEHHWTMLYRVKLYNGALVALIYTICLGAALALSVHGVAGGTMTVGDLVLINSYMVQIMRPFEMLGVAFRDLLQGTAFVLKMSDLLHTETEQLEHRTGPALRLHGAPKLTFSRVSLFYQPDRPVLSDISFTVRPGETMALVGPSGAGKSSIIRLLIRLVEPVHGTIELDGVPISSLSLSQLRRHVAVVPQDTILFNDSIEFNIGLGLDIYTRRDIEIAAKAANAHPFIMCLPHGYDTVVGERGLKLSGGERQRIALARAAIKRPHVLIMDEATSALDSETERETLRRISASTRKTTKIVVAHRLSTIIGASKILVLERGTIAESGSHDVLLARGGAYTKMWYAQARQGAHIDEAPVGSICG